MHAACMIAYPQMGICSGSHDLYEFCEITDSISETVKDRNILIKITNRK